MAWKLKWNVPGSKGKTWVVAINDRNEFACSCPVWKFRRQECKHIKLIKAQNNMVGNLPIMNNVKAKTKNIAKVEIAFNIVPAIKVGRNFNFDE